MPSWMAWAQRPSGLIKSGGKRKKRMFHESEY